MLRMEFTQKDKEHNMYHWHPLFEKVESIENAFAIAVYRVYKSGGIDDYQKEMYLSNFTNFKNQLKKEFSLQDWITQNKNSWILTL